MKDFDLIREADRRHVRQLFDLFAISEYDVFELITAYSTTDSRVRADAGSEYFILKQPVNILNEILRGRPIQKAVHNVDRIILHWMAEMYIFARYEKNLSFREMMLQVPPEWLYAHYSPLHEATMENAWEKASLCH